MERKTSTSLLILLGLNVGAVYGFENTTPQSTVPTSTIQDTQDIAVSATPETAAINTNEIQFGKAYKTQPNQTLWSIAKILVKNSEFSIAQGVNAITVKNPEALRTNTQQIKKGALLNLPTHEEMKLVSHATLVTNTTAAHQVATAMNQSQPQQVATVYSADPAPLPGSSSTDTTTTTITTTDTQAPKGSHTQTTTETTTAAAPTEIAVVTEEPVSTVALLPVGHLPKPTTYQGVMDRVIGQNGGYSNAPLFVCADGDRFCFSGLLDLDARYYDRKGNPGFGTQGPIEASSFGGVGVRPVFGPSGRTFIGSINNANAFIDLRLPPFGKIHSNLAYVNGSVFLNSYAWEFGADWGSVYRIPAALKVDELYITFGNADLLPLYLKIGRMYSDFGDYVPNAYGIKTITPSLTQLMTQSRTGAGQVGLVLQNGIYGSLSVSYAAQSIGQDNRPADLFTRTGLASNKRNFSGKLGYRNPIFLDIEADLNLSYMADLRDVDYLNDSIWFISEFLNQPLTIQHTHLMNKQGGLAYHAAFYRCPFGITFEGMYSSGKMNPGTDVTPGTWDSHIRTGGVEGRVDFKTLEHASNIRLAYQWARHTQVIAGSFVGGNPTFHNMLPRNRWQGTYSINVLEHYNLGLEWVRDHDFDEPRNGIDATSNMVIARLDVEF